MQTLAGDLEVHCASTDLCRPGYRHLSSYAGSSESVERVRRQHEPARRAVAPANGLARAVKSGAARRGDRGVSDAFVVGYPTQDRGRVIALGENHRALDHRASGGVRARQAFDPSADRICRHVTHPTWLR